MKSSFHSVALVKEKCIGCTDCIKRCPTEAIRVRNGQASIIHNRCIDCGMCIKVCRNHAKKATTQTMDMIRAFKYPVAIPAPTLYGQFRDTTDINVILTGIKRLGFTEVFEVARAAEFVTDATLTYIRDHDLPKPIISSACPAITKLIAMRFPELIDNILPLTSPMEVAATAAKNHLEKQGIPRKDIGVFFISPCAAKHTNVVAPMGISHSEVDGIISIQDVFMPLRNKIAALDAEEIETLAQSSAHGVEWAIIGGESKNIEVNSIAVDGIENVIKVLEELENGQMENIEFIELLSCTGGCIGGPLTVVNNFLAKNNLRQLERFMEQDSASHTRDINFNTDNINLEFTEKIQQTGVMKLDNDMSAAIAKMERINALIKDLPGIDCGACGAPTCDALAEDIVMDRANTEDCVFMLRNKVKLLAESMVELASKLPQTTSEVKR